MPRRSNGEKSPRKRGHLTHLLALTFILCALALIGVLTITNKNPNQSTSHLLKAVKNIYSSTNLDSKLQKAWKKRLKDTDQNVSIAVYSAKTGQTYSATNASKHKFYTASTVKVSILAGLMIKENGDLDSTEQELATEMIENSNNDATTELFQDYLGGKEGLQKVFDTFQMTHSTAGSSWGLTSTTAADQVRLLNNIFFSSDKLTKSERSYIKGLMENVEADQRWGISAGSSNYAIKNGWLPYGSRKRIINSIGYIQGSGDNRYTIAVYTDGNSSMSEGESLIESFAKDTRKIMTEFAKNK